MTAGAVIWITGLPSAGKTSLARRLVDDLDARHVARLWLDSDDIRQVMTPRPTYEPSERDVFYATLGRVAERGAEGGVTVVVSATAPRRAYRDEVRERVETFVEVWLRCDDEELERRDHRGLYSRYAEGRVRNVPGRDAPYEEPRDAELVLDSARLGPGELAGRVARWLVQRAIAPPTP
jgi:adenylylsulfate kinase